MFFKYVTFNDRYVKKDGPLIFELASKIINSVALKHQKNDNIIRHFSYSDINRGGIYYVFKKDKDHMYIRTGR